MGHKESNQTNKQIPSKNSTLSTEKCIAVFAKAFPINLFETFIKTHLTITKIWWLVTSTLKATDCILDSFVSDLGIRDPLKFSVIWQHYDLDILGPNKILVILQRCHLFVNIWHEVQRSRLQSLQKHVPSIFFPFFFKTFLKIALVW